MLNFNDLLATYPPILHHHQEHIFKEYLQYHILEAIFSSPVAEKLCFIGWTALRLIYDNQRFSEDLGFDNRWLSFEEFDEAMQYVTTSLELKWFLVEMRTIKKWAYHCHIKFPELLYQQGFSPLKNSKIVIQIDTHDQWYIHTFEKKRLEKFETLSLVNVASPHLLLAQKLRTVFERVRTKGRDFFDIIFLLRITKQPDRWFLQQSLGINSPQALKSYILDHCVWLNFKALHEDVQPFLFQPTNQSVLQFPEFIKQIAFEK